MILCKDVHALLHVISLVDWPKHVKYRSPACMLCAWTEPLSCLCLSVNCLSVNCLEFAEAPTRILRFLYPVDIGITTATSPALDIAALCLDSWPAAIFTQFDLRLLPAITYQLTAASLL